MGSSLYEVFVISQLIGRDEMQRYVGRTSPGFDLRSNRPPSKGEFAEDVPLEMPDVLRRAQDYFIKKKVINKLDFLKLSAEMRWQAFTVAKVSDKQILERFKEKLNAALDSGITIEDFAGEIEMTFDAMGVTPLNPYHLDTVFLTNTMTGYGEGRKQVVDSLSVDEFPYRQVVTVGDDRVRDSHAELEGYVAEKDDPVWSWLKTPFSFRCRCGIWPVHVSEGLVPSGYVPDVRGKAGFEFLN